MTAEQKRREDYKSGTGAPALPRGRAPRKDNAVTARKYTMEARVKTRSNKGRVGAPVDPSALHDKPSCGVLDSQRRLAKRGSKVPAPKVGTVLDVQGWPEAERKRALRWLQTAELISKQLA